MNIIYVCNEYPPAPHGGIGTFTKILSEELTKKGHGVSVVGFDPTVKKQVKELLNGVKVYRYPLPSQGKGKFRQVWSFFNKRRKLSNILEQNISYFKPDIVESYDWSGPLIKKPSRGYLVVRMHGAHAVHGLMMRKKNSRLLSIFESKNLKFADALIGVSKYISKQTAACFGLQERNIKTIYNGVDTEKFKPNPRSKVDPHKLVFVGRMHPYKGVDLMFQALEIVFRKNKNAHLDFIGSIDSDYAQQLIDSLSDDIKSRINFLGRIANEKLPDVYGAAHMCLLPSRVEAFPIVPLESMACGTPVIMSNLVAANEIIDDKEDGYVVDPTNATAFAACILEALSKRSETSQMSTRCREKILNSFSMDVIVEENEKFYENCLG